ncbi:aminotransferase class I/II-fold pyridoxal phosphate-dependent enzyme [Alphaproteobacteria bacterium]|nr:aminotransferase class I/II-fold pyridoxal phosphate-dependent enzyme [Alphaproteobacteria bacterium]
MSEDYGFETRMIHAGSRPEAVSGARQTPIFQNTSYVFQDVDHAADLFNLQDFGFIYSRLTNPTVSVLEERMASLEGGRGATCSASGHAAQMLLMQALMLPGARVVVSTKLYGGSITQFGKTFKKFAWHADFVDTNDLSAVEAAMTEDTRAIFVESLANPGGVVSDLEGLAKIANAHGVPLVVDNTLATPYLCRPFEWGADLIVHSTTKYMSGNGTSLGGCVVDSGTFNWAQNDKFPSLAQPEEAYHGLTFFETFGDMALTAYLHAVGLRDLGASMAPQNAFQTILGSETLSLRMERHCTNAQKIAEYLESHPAITAVSYAGLKSSSFYQLGQKYMPLGQGGVFTAQLKGGFAAGVKFVESVNLFSHLANVGDARSLVLHPASTTHRQLTPEQREAAGAGDDIVRISVGLETVSDLIRDLDQALAD